MPRYGELEDEKIIPEGGGYPSKESDLSSFLKERLKKAKDEAGDTLRGIAGMSPGEGRSGDTLGYAGGRMIGSVASRGLTDAYANNKERVPNIIGNIAEKFAPSELEKKTGVATDSRLQALMNLKNKDRDFFQDVKALRKDIGETLASTLPGQGGGMSHAMSPTMSPVVANRRVTRVADNLPGQGGEMFNAMFHAMFPTMSPAMSFAMSPAMSPVVANRRVTRVADNLPGQGGGMFHAMSPATLAKTIKGRGGKRLTVSEAMDNELLNSSSGKRLPHNAFENRQTLNEEIQSGGAFTDPFHSGKAMGVDERDAVSIMLGKIKEVSPEERIRVTSPVPRNIPAGRLSKITKDAISDEAGLKFLKRAGYSN